MAIWVLPFNCHQVNGTVHLKQVASSVLGHLETNKATNTTFQFINEKNLELSLTNVLLIEPQAEEYQHFHILKCLISYCE